MDPRLLNYYNQELQHLREMGAEFATAFPKIAARLGMSGIEVTDPYVERLLEGFAFLTGRVQLKMDAEFPRFTQRLLEIVYPGYLAPTPSMLIARFVPQAGEAGLATGHRLPRGSTLRSGNNKGELTPCEFRTAHDLTLWPIEIAAADYFSFAPDLPLARLGLTRQVKGGLRLRLRTTAGLSFDQLDLDRLRIHFSGSEDTAHRLYELVLGACVGVLAGPALRPMPWYEVKGAAAVAPVGFDDDQALLPTGARSFQGHRLLKEFFAFPHRFLFADIDGLRPVCRRHKGTELDVVLLFARGDAALEGVVDASNIALHCVPAVNLFSKRLDRIHLGDGAHEYHAVPDRTRPTDFEIYEMTNVVGFGAENESEQRFLPLYAACHAEDSHHAAFYTTRREQRLLSARQKRTGFRSSYVGSEVYIALVDPHEAPYRADLRQLSLTALCSNRDLPLLMPLGGSSDFALDAAAPLSAIHCLKGPTRPAPPLAEGSASWHLISQLSLNYLSLLDGDDGQAAALLRDLLRLSAGAEAANARQIEGVRSVRSRPLTRRLPLPGPITYGRGLELEIEVNEMAFQGASAFLLGSVLQRFLARHVSINSFTETVLRSQERGEIMRWNPICGTRPII